MVLRKPISNLLGKTYNRLTIVKYLGKRKWDKHYWECFCRCGGNIILNTSRITSNSATKSCGCLRKETVLENRKDPTKHGFTISHPKLYAIYHNMIQRCYNVNSCSFDRYGGKGIKVCNEWRDDSIEFITWAITNGYQEGLSIDRLNPREGYCPSNCEWCTLSENVRRAGEFRRNEKFKQGTTV